MNPRGTPGICPCSLYVWGCFYAISNNNNQFQKYVVAGKRHMSNAHSSFFIPPLFSKCRQKLQYCLGDPSLCKHNLPVLSKIVYYTCQKHQSRDRKHILQGKNKIFIQWHSSFFLLINTHERQKIA